MELRKILPKGTSFEGLDPHVLAEICSHVNSTVRRGCGDAAPFDLAALMFPPYLFENLGLRRVPPEDVIAAPNILYRPEQGTLQEATSSTRSEEKLRDDTDSSSCFVRKSDRGHARGLRQHALERPLLRLGCRNSAISRLRRCVRAPNPCGRAAALHFVWQYGSCPGDQPLGGAC